MGSDYFHRVRVYTFLVEASYYTPVIQHSNGTSTMTEDVFPIQDGDSPASYVCLPEGYHLKEGAPHERMVHLIHLLPVIFRGHPPWHLIWLEWPRVMVENDPEWCSDHCVLKKNRVGYDPCLYQFFYFEMLNDVKDTESSKSRWYTV